MSDISYIMLKGKCRWAKVHDPVPTFDKTGMQWEIDIEANEDVLKELRSRGAAKKTNLKEAEDGWTYLTFRKPTHSKKGKQLPPPVVIGRDCKPFNELIGNGSEVAVKISLIPYNHATFGSGVSMRLAGVQVLEHVKFEKKDGDGLLEGFDVLDVEDTDDPLASMVSDEDI